MKLWKSLLFTAAYCVGTLFVLGFALVVFGDCNTDPRPNGKCLHEATRLRHLGLVVAAVGYPVFMYLIWRDQRRRTRPVRTAG
jgi:ABC-type Fe3+-siderophore transport system permease subunit